jgi:hypothetical protein
MASSLEYRSFLPRPPSAEVIDAVLRFADIEEDLGGGRTHYRLSERRLRQREVRKALGKEGVARAADVGVVWDERQDQIVRVFDRAA